MRVAITGTGLLGHGIFEAISQNHPDWETLLFSRHEPALELRGRWARLDISDFESTRKTITKFNPDCVIHTAAMRNPDLCEENPEEAFRANFLGTRNLALACDRFDSELVYISSDQVFYGIPENKRHAEWDEPRAKNVYGQTKLLGERYIQNHLRRYWIVRTAKLFGGPGDTLKSFPSQFLEAIHKKKKIRAATNWLGHLTYVPDLAETLMKLITKKTYGIYHLVSSNIASYAQIAHFMAEHLKQGAQLIEEARYEDMRLAAPRAKECFLSAQLWEFDFNEKFPAWQDGLQKFLQETGSL